MKKIFLALTAVVMTVISVSAQDLATATETFNNGAMELQMGNMEAALTNFHLPHRAMKMEKKTVAGLSNRWLARAVPQAELRFQ